MDAANNSPADDDSDSEREVVVPPPEQPEVKNVVLEIKTLSSKEKLRMARRLRDDNGDSFFECQLGSDTFKNLVYDPKYRVQVLHHGAACDLLDVVFVVADDHKVIYSTWITITCKQLETFKLILLLVYDADLKWAYTGAWNATDPSEHIPDF